MKKPVGPTRAKRKTADIPVAAGLSWREFFVRLGEGTLHDDVVADTRRDAPDPDSPPPEPPAVIAPR